MLEEEDHRGHWRRFLVIAGGGGSWRSLEEVPGDCWRRRFMVIIGGGRLW
jgi:hypothetical protein